MKWIHGHYEHPKFTFFHNKKAKFCESQYKMMFVRTPVEERDVIRNVIPCRCSEHLPLTHTRTLLYRSVSLSLQPRHFGRLFIERVFLCKAFSLDEPHQGDWKNHCHNAAKTDEGCHLHFTALIFWSVTGRRCAQAVVVHFPRRFPKKPQPVHLCWSENIRHVIEILLPRAMSVFIYVRF